MVFHLLAILNEFERDLISERTKVALTYKKNKNERVGNIQYGFKVAENKIDLIVNEDEMKIANVAKSYKNKGLSLRKIAEKLDEQGFVG